APACPTLFPYTTLFRSGCLVSGVRQLRDRRSGRGQGAVKFMPATRWQYEKIDLAATPLEEGDIVLLNERGGEVVAVVGVKGIGFVRAMRHNYERVAAVIA